jgi:type II secretion system protein G
MNLSISRDGVEIGEWTEEEVRTLYSQGQLLPTDYYWKEGMAEWKELGTILKPPPPPAGIEADVTPKKDVPNQVVFPPSSDEQELNAGFKRPSKPSLISKRMSLSKLLFSFHGRISRRLYWIVTIVIASINWSYFIFEFSMSAKYSNESSSEFRMPGLALDVVSLVAFLWMLVAIWISLALQVKRWHDRGKSGWMVLINLIPFVGPPLALIENGFLQGTPGANEFGENPLQTIIPAHSKPDIQFYLYLNDQQVGPYSLDQIQQLLDQGKITTESLAWYEGLAGWVPVSEVLSDANVLHDDFQANKQARLSTKGGDQKRGLSILQIVGIAFVALSGLLNPVLGLAAWVIYNEPTIITLVEMQKTAKAQTDIDNFKYVLGTYEVDIGAPPTTEQGLSALWTKPTVEPIPQRWGGMYIKPNLDASGQIDDPWGHPYQYRNPGKHNPNGYDVFSKGPDGKPDTDDDIGNW